MLFGKGTKPLGNEALLEEEVHHWEWASKSPSTGPASCSILILSVQIKYDLPGPALAAVLLHHRALNLLYFAWPWHLSPHEKVTNTVVPMFPSTDQGQDGLLEVRSMAPFVDLVLLYLSDGQLCFLLTTDHCLLSMLCPFPCLWSHSWLPKPTFGGWSVPRSSIAKNGIFRITL